MFLVVLLFVSSILVDYQTEARTTGRVNVKIKGPVDLTEVPIGEACNISSQCISNTVCQNQICRCEHPYQLFEKECVSAVVPLGGECQFYWQCPKNAVCNVKLFSKACACATDYYEDLGQCFPVSPVGKPCNSSKQCMFNAMCSRGLCICDESHYEHQGRCSPKLQPFKPCNVSSQCIDNASCSLGICKCSTFYYEYKQRCIISQRPLGYSCEDDRQCTNSDPLTICSKDLCICRNGYEPNRIFCRSSPDDDYPPTNTSVLKTAMIVVGSVIVIAVVIMGYLHCKNLLRNYDPPSHPAETRNQATTDPPNLTRSSERLIFDPNEDQNTLPRYEDKPPSYDEAVGASNTTLAS